MATTEKTSEESSTEQNAAPASTPNVVVNTPARSESANKANPNLVMALVLCFMLFIGLALVLAFNEGLGLGGKDDPDELSEKEKLQRMIDAERGGASADELASDAALEGRIATILDNTHAIQSEFEAIRVGYKDAKEKLAQLENQVRGNMNTISRLGSQNTSLSSENTKLRTLAANAQAYQNQVQSLANSNAEKDALIASLQDGAGKDNVQQLKEIINKEQMAKADLVRQLQNLEAKMEAKIDAADGEKLTMLQTQNEELRRQLQALQTRLDFTKLFVKSHTSLPAHAQVLYTELKGLEGYDEEKLRAAYTKIADDHNAEIIQQVKFETGSFILNFTDQKMIKSKLDTTQATDYFLVVGYASKTGDASNNETLSANRATAVASIVNQLKKEGQDVRAVYLGQTDRFSKSEIADNQLCEIWRIKQ